MSTLYVPSPLPHSPPPPPLTSSHSLTIQFANVHDVSWGTKGDNKIQTDLGKVEVKQENNNEVDVSMPVTQEQLNAGYEDAIHVLKTKPPKVEGKMDPGTVQEDYYRGFRTK
jgi:chitin synthase